MKGTIQTLSFGGEGILRSDGLVVFVPFTAPQDEAIVEIVSKKKNFAHGKLVQLLKKSQSRIEPRCEHFGACGGCQLQHLNYSAQLEAKRQFIIDALQRIGKIPISDVTVTPAQEWNYRLHIRMKLKKCDKGFQAGYMGNDIFVPINECPIFSGDIPHIQTLLQSLSNEGVDEGHLRIMNNNLLAFDFMPRLPKNAQEVFANYSVVMQSPHEKKEWGNTLCETQLLDLRLRFSPFGFVQNHITQTEVLYRAILEALPAEADKILDLYCGIGATSLLFARMQKQVIGVESHAETVELAKENAKRNGISSCEFYEGKAEKLGVELLKKEKPDTVLCNPPRTGLDPLLVEALLEAKPACILYVSCMPSTLARDLQKFIAGGYRLDQIQGFDMFPQTTHVETLVRLKTV
jgi:23S rRNA (uracil1939-C5)-methyltransferase